jgi:hypothetical protein
MSDAGIFLSDITRKEMIPASLPDFVKEDQRAVGAVGSSAG